MLWVVASFDPPHPLLLRTKLVKLDGDYMDFGRINTYPLNVADSAEKVLRQFKESFVDHEIQPIASWEFDFSLL